MSWMDVSLTWEKLWLFPLLEIFARACLNVELENIQSLIKQMNFKDKLDNQDFLAGLMKNVKRNVVPARGELELTDLLRRLGVALDELGNLGELDEDKYENLQKEVGRGNASIYLAIASYKLMQKYNLAPTSTLVGLE